MEIEQQAPVECIAPERLAGPCYCKATAAIPAAGRWNRSPEIWLAVVLFLTSQLFVFSFSTIARWTTNAQVSKLSDYCLNDCKWYGEIASQGYDLQPSRELHPEMANWVFFPLFPLSARALHLVIGRDVSTAVVLAGRIEFFFAIFAFLLLVRKEAENRSQLFLAGALVAFNPYLIYANTGYTEPLYFLLACLAFYALREKRWVLAGVLGALLSATRPVGVLFMISYAIVALPELGWKDVQWKHVLSALIGILLCPLGLVIFALYLYHRTGDGLAFAHMQVGWRSLPSNPIALLWHALSRYDWLRARALMCVGALAVSCWLIRKRSEFAIFLGLNVFTIASSGNLQSTPRYLWWQLPMIYATWLWLMRSPNGAMVYFVFASGMAATMVLYWFSGAHIVF
jgi:Gpi18-like mannosyltransferase